MLKLNKYIILLLLQTLNPLSLAFEVELKSNTPIELKLMLNHFDFSEEKMKELDHGLSLLSETERLFIIKSAFYKIILAEFQDNDLKAQAKSNLSELVKKIDHKLSIENESPLLQWLLANFKQDLIKASLEQSNIGTNKLKLILPWVKYLTETPTLDIQAKLKDICTRFLNQLYQNIQIQLNLLEALWKLR